jgi:hypothetical protein
MSLVRLFNEPAGRAWLARQGVPEALVHSLDRLGISSVANVLSARDRRRIHDLKYFTWVEQQGKTYDEIMAQWYQPDYWTSIHAQVEEIDALIDSFNERAGLGQ